VYLCYHAIIMLGAEIQEFTAEELLLEAERLAQAVLHVGREEAFHRLDQGQYRGTIFASKMTSIRFLLRI
jgi:hypothetical protein